MDIKFYMWLDIIMLQNEVYVYNSGQIWLKYWTLASK